MMKAVKVMGRITEDHRLEVILPSDTPTGNAEVIVLVDEPEAGSNDQSDYLKALFRDLDASDRSRSTKDEIDRYLAEERASWERGS